jgi:hypothetical protein
MGKRQKKTPINDGEKDVVESLPASNVRRDDSQIRKRAYEIFLERGDAPGDAVSDWLSAAAEFRRAPERPQVIGQNAEPSANEHSS